MDKTIKKLNVRAFVALMIFFTGLGLPVTGLANHLYQFTPLTVARHAWMSAHNTLAILFVIFSTWHVLLNRRPLWNHVKGIAVHGPSVSREAVLAGVILVLSLFLFVGHAFLAS